MYNPGFRSRSTLKVFYYSFVHLSMFFCFFSVDMFSLAFKLFRDRWSFLRKFLLRLGPNAIKPLRYNVDIKMLQGFSSMVNVPSKNVFFEQTRFFSDHDHFLHHHDDRA